jgi:hypothetical protein
LRMMEQYLPKALLGIKMTILTDHSHTLVPTIGSTFSCPGSLIKIGSSAHKASSARSKYSFLTHWSIDLMGMTVSSGMVIRISCSGHSKLGKSKVQ